MDHLTAARLSKTGIALRIDNDCLVMYAQKNGKLVIAKDPEGILWRELDPAEAYRYKDWMPAPDTLWEAWRRFLRTLKRWVPFRT